MLRKIITVLLIALVLLSSCSNKDGKTENPVTEEQIAFQSQESLTDACLQYADEISADISLIPAYAE